MAMAMARNGRKFLEMAKNGWTQHEMTGNCCNGWKQHEIAGSAWKWLEWLAMPENRLQLLDAIYIKIIDVNVGKFFSK